MLRNRELRRFAVCFCAAAAAAVAAGFVIGRAAGLLAAAAVCAFGAMFYVFERGRYRRIARLSDQIDRVLHNTERVFIGGEEEGELAILQSEISKMTQRVREQNRELVKEKERLADSLADVAHQLRTPLTSVNLILPLLEDCPDEEQRRALLREAKGLFEQMDWLLVSLLKLSRLDAGIVSFQREPVAVEELLGAALRPLLIPLELHGVSVKTDVPPGLCLPCDRGWLSEALQNILKNCMESAGDGGRIEIACTDNPLYTEITVRDSGAGVAPEDLPFLFERFYRGKNAAATGYGIGLALSRRIVTGQGGTVTAKNHPQGGAVFSLRFPK